MPIVELIGVTKTYGRDRRDRPAVDDVTFGVPEGAFTLLWGPSGAGKSTILRMVLAMERPEAGTVRVAERDVHRLRAGSIPYLRRNVGAVFQDFKLLPEATPLHNVALCLEVLGEPPKEVRRRARQALIAVEIDPELRRPVRSLSGGEQQRVAVARALATEPAILLADEPTGNLDPRLSRDILELLARVCSRGTTVLLATHDPDVRQYVEVTQELHLDEGRLVLDTLDTAGAYARLAASQSFDEEPGPQAVAGVA